MRYLSPHKLQIKTLCTASLLCPLCPWPCTPDLAWHCVSRVTILCRNSISAPHVRCHSVTSVYSLCLRWVTGQWSHPVPGSHLLTANCPLIILKVSWAVIKQTILIFNVYKASNNPNIRAAYLISVFTLGLNSLFECSGSLCHDLRYWSRPQELSDSDTRGRHC